MNIKDDLMDVNNGSVSDKEKTKLIRQEISAAGKALKEKFPILKHQNAIGITIHLISTIMIVGASILYLKGILNIWILIPFNAIWMSILHELEHDTIHYMYFKKHKWIQDYMLGMGWILRPMTINPWFRRFIHFNHHRVSGTRTDVEERGLTNGEKWNFLRLIKIPDLIFGGLLRMHTLRKDLKECYKSGELKVEDAIALKKINKLGFLPFGLPLHLIWYFFIIHYLVLGFTAVFGIQYSSPQWIHEQFNWINPLVAILIAPNMLRQFCLHFITSNMHYYGDIESGNILQQTQILDAWWLFPFQLFCFNFGQTHGIHHFVVNETFYVRQFTSKRSIAIMKKLGVRHNDFGTFRRANRYNLKNA